VRIAAFRALRARVAARSRMSGATLVAREADLTLRLLESVSITL